MNLGDPLHSIVSPVLHNELGNRPYHNHNYVNTISAICCDKEFLLSEEPLDNSNHNNNIVYNCPEIPILINNIPTNCLIDTGAEISCLSEQWFSENKHRLNKLCEFPVTSVHIKTATNDKSKKISKIIYIPVTIEQHELELEFLIVPNLIKPVIFGIDVLAKLAMEINFDKYICKMRINNNDIILKFRLDNSNGLMCHIVNDNDINKYNEYNDYNEYNNINNDCDTPQGLIPPLSNVHDYVTRQIIDETLSTNILLDARQKKELADLLESYQHIFTDKPGRCNKYQHKLEVNNPESFKCQNYPVPLVHQEKVMEEINRMLNEDLIERSNSPYINPIIPVIKKSGEIRLCIDARRINKLIIPDHECSRSVNELLSKCKHSKWLTSIDLSASYWQILLTPESRQFTAFQFRGKTYQFKVTPFGISTSQAALVRALDQVFDDTIESFTVIYIDDICIISPNFETHLMHLDHVFSKLKEANMTIKFNKSSFCQTSIPFLGYTLTETGLQMDSSKVDPILKYPSPKNRKQLKSFLGCINYYNKFLEKYSETIQPLLRLTSKKNKFIWTEEDERIFNNIKQLFINTNTLHHPDPTRTFYLQTDASDFAIGGHLYQINDAGEKAAIIFISRALKPAEQRYTTTEKELLAVVHCLQKTRHIILGTKLKILTDNHAITFLKTCRLLNNRLTRWILAIQEYNFEIEHIKGTDNQTADALSRITHPTGLTSEDNTREFIISYIQRFTDQHLKDALLNLPHIQSTDPHISPIYNVLTTGPASPHYNHISKVYKLHDDILYKKLKDKWLIDVPENLIVRLVWDCHLFYLHCGAKKCFDVLSESFVFKNMYRRIRTIIATCDSCQRCKTDPKPSIGLSKGINCTQKNDQLAIDIIGPLPTSVGNVKYILIVIDIFTKFVKLYSMRSANTRTIINKLFGIHFINHGLPNKIQSDNGTQFKSKNWIKKLEENNITPIFSPVYHPQFNMAERPIKEIKRCLRTYCSHQQRNWSRYLEDINNCLNELHHETTGFTPNELQFGVRDQKFWEDYLLNPFIPQIPHERKLELASQRIRTKQLKRAERANRNKKFTNFNIGDLVLIKTHPQSNALSGETAKLFHIFEGPFRISRTLGRNTYFVTLPEDDTREYGLYHTSAIKKYKEPIAI